MLILRLNLNLIISGKTVHKGKYLTSYTLIQNLIIKWCGEIILRTCTIYVTEMSAYADLSLLLIHRNGIWNPLCQGNEIDKISFEQFLYLSFNGGCFSRIHGMQTLSNRFCIRIGLDFVFDNMRVYTYNLFIWPSENIMKLLKHIGILFNLIGGTTCPNVDILNLTKITRNIDRNHWS